MNREEAKYLSEVLKACSECKPIQDRNLNPESGYSDWRDIGYISLYDVTMDYTVKPEQKYRPYTNAEELLQAQTEHWPYIKGTTSLWCGTYRIPSDVHHGCIGLYDYYKTWEDLFNYLSWQDGAKCCIIEY